VEKENPYLMVVKNSQIVDLSVMPEDESVGHITPIVDLKIGKSVDYDSSQQTIFWTELENEKDKNGTLYYSNIGGGDKINFFGEFDTGMVLIHRTVNCTGWIRVVLEYRLRLEKPIWMEATQRYC